MSYNPLFLSADGLFRLSHQEQAPIASWRLSSSLCLVSRDCYWEQIAYYPTSNLLEVQKIVSSEISQVSPLPGQTQAFVVKTEKGQTTILYCCFSPALLAKAESYNLWRLVPETLPLYRSLSTQDKPYLVDVTLTPYLNKTPEGETFHRLVINALSNGLASLPYKDDPAPPLPGTLAEESTKIDNQAFLNTLSKFRLLDFLDSARHFSKRIRFILTKNKQLPVVAATFLICATLAFTLSKSALLLWQHDSLTNEISSTRAEATQSIKLLNQLKQSKQAVDSINKRLNEHGPKTQILHLLSKMSSSNVELSFKTVNISPTDIQLQGVTDNASSLLSKLSTISGFTEVKFSTPPRTLKNVGELFNISILYDRQIYSGSSTP